MESAEKVYGLQPLQEKQAKRLQQKIGREINTPSPNQWMYFCLCCQVYKLYKCTLFLSFYWSSH